MLNKSASKSRKQSQGPPARTAAQQTEVTRLRQQLISKQKQIKDLQEELLDQNQQYLAAIKERDAGTEKLKNAKESMGRFDALVKTQVDRAMAAERKEKELLEKKLKEKENECEMLKEAKVYLDQKNKELNDLLGDLRKTNEQGQKPSNFETKSKDLQKALDKKEKEFDKLKKHINYLQDQMEDFMAENKQLRDLSAVPDNFGIDREKVRLMDREKIDDFKKLVRILQEDNYQLESERAQLKHKIKQLSMLNKNTNTDGRYDQFNLTPDQWSQVDRYVMNLINGVVIDAPDVYDIKMTNEILKAQIEVYKDKDVDKVRSQMELVLKQLTGEGPEGEKGLLAGGINQEQFNQIMGGYEDIKKQLNLIADQGIALGKLDDPNSNSFKLNQTANLSYAQMSQLMIPGHSRAPEPTINADGTIQSGYSFRYGTHLPVTGRQGEKEGVDKQDIDNAFLQLQLLECFEKIDKQDEVMRAQKREVDQLYGRIQRYILMQDHLYKDYAKLEKKNEELSKRAAAKAMDAEEQLQIEKQKVKDLENLVQQLQRQPGTDSNLKQIIDLQKQNTILEVNMIQATRKYQNLDEKEKLLRRNYEVVHGQMSDMQVECQERICELKAWKSNAIFQMKGAFEQLKTAYPEAEYQRLEGELKLINNKYADQINTITELRSELQEFKINQRKINEQADEQMELIEYKEDLEKHYNYLSSRLKDADQRYRYEQDLIRKMVKRLKKSNLSIDKAFAKFDKDHDGYITPQEMADAIFDMGFDDMSHKDLDILMKSIDTDENGLIEYKEFKFLLQRCGLKSRSIEETIVYNIIRTIQNKRIQKSQLFELIDKDSKGYITKLDFKDFLDQLRSEHITDTDIENFINYFFKHESGGDLNLHAFLGKFSMYEKMMKDDEQGEEREALKDARPPISQDTLRQKKAFFDNLKEAIDSVEGATLRILFNKIDSDRSGEISFKEFRQLFAQVKIQFKDEELLDIFKSLDVDGSGSVEFAELQLDFTNVTTKSFPELWEQERLNRAAYNEMVDQDLEGFGISYSQRGASGFRGGAGGMSDIMKADLERKINSLESKLKISQKEIKKEQELKDINNKTLVFLQKSYDEIKMQFQHAKEEIFNHEVKIKILTDEQRNSISKENSEKIQQENVALKTELRETKSAMLSYKNLHNVVCEQVKSLKLMIERRKDENESLHQSVREMAAESMDNSKMDKLRYVVMLSRWQEAAVNKKYDMKINECNVLKTQIIEKDEEIRSMEQAREQNQNDSSRLVQENQSLRKQLARAKILFLPLNKAEKFEDDIKKISHERDQIEINYFKLRSEHTTVKNMRDSLQIRVDTYQEWKSKLENAKQPQLTSEITKMIDKIQDMRIKTLKAESRASEMTERNAHLEKLLDIKKKEASALEEKFAKIERDLEVQKQQWRERDNERIKKFFAAKLKEEDQQREIERRRAEKLAQFAPQPAHDILNDDSRPKSAAETLKDQQIEQLRDTCAKLQDRLNELEEQNALLDKFSDQNLKVLGNPQQQMDQKIEQYAYQFQQVSRSEKEEILEAAQETIKTLNEMLDHKKKQLATKERQIEKLRDELLQQRQRSADEVRALRDEAYAKGSSTLAKLHDYVDQHATGAGRPGLLDEADNFKRQARAGELELQKANTALERLRELNEQAQSDLEHERARALAAKSSYEGEIEDQKVEIGRLKSQIQLEKRKREDLAKQRLQKNDNMYRKFHEKMLEQEKEILKLKDQNEVWKMRDKASKQMGGADKVDYAGASSTEQDQAITKLQDLLKKRDQELVDQRKKLDKSKASKESIQGEKDQLSKTLTKLQDTNNRLMQDKQRQDEVVSKLNSELRHLKNEVYELRVENKRHVAEKQGVGQGQTSFKELEEQLQDANDQNNILRQQKATVVAFNPKSQAFEYIGDPLPLRQDGAEEIETIDQLLKEITKWHGRPGNDRISVGQIFQSVDMHSYEELSPEQFNDAMLLCGIRLRDRELTLLKNHLVKDQLGQMGQMKYMTMVRALSGIPQQDFMGKGINKLAAVVEARNLTKTEFEQLIDPGRLSGMTLEQLQEAFKNARHGDFRFDETEVRRIFLDVTGTKNPAGIKIDVDKLTAHVFESVKALLLEQIRQCLLRQDSNLNKFYQAFDRNRDDILDTKEFERGLGEYGLHIPPNLLLFLYHEVLDPKAATQRRSPRIAKAVLRKYVECFGAMGSKMVRVRDRPQEQAVAIGDRELVSRPAGNISPEDEARSKITSRKILAKLHQNLLDLISKLDHLEDGIILRTELAQALLDSKVPDLHNEEVVNLLRLQDRGDRGYISITRFIDNIYEFATETETDQILRRVANAVAQSTNVSVRESLDLVDTSGNGLLEKQDLKRALKNCRIPISDNELDAVYKEMGDKIPQGDNQDVERQIKSRTLDSGRGSSSGTGSMSKTALKTEGRAKHLQTMVPVMDTRKFMARIELIGKSKPLPQYIFNQKGGKASTVKPGASAGMMTAYDNEKKYAKNLDLLRTEIEEKNREIDAKDKEIRECKTRISNQEKEKKKLETQLMNKDQKPPKQTQDDSQAFNQAQELMAVKDQLNYQQDENLKLKKAMKVTLKAEITRITAEKDALDEKMRDKNDEISKLQNTIQRLFARPMDDVEKREEFQLQKQFKITELEDMVSALEKEKDGLQDELFKAHETNLSLKFEKETYDLQYARLQKRIKDLEQYKDKTSNISSKLFQEEQEDLDEIDEQTGKVAASQKKKKESVKFRKKPIQSISELEMVVESLKRVVEKLKVENEQLKKENAKYSGVGEKVNLEKSLRTKISNLETIIHSYEMKDVNLDEQKLTIKKLIEANKQLRGDLEKEVDRYQLLENKYRDVLSKFNLLDKENQRNEEMIFGMTTGTNIRRHQNYMLEDIDNE